MAEALPPGGTIGILGGGQLARMLSVAASRLALRCHVYQPGDDACAGHVAHALTRAPFDDVAALSAFADRVDVVTYEFENVPTATLDLLEARRPIRPGREALRISQDRLLEKDFLTRLGLATAPYAGVRDAAELAAALARVGHPAILKTRRFGYDGKGQARIRTPGDAPAALAAMRGAPAILEGFVDFRCEISVIGARGLGGEIACYDPGENVHRAGILHTTTVPARVDAATRAEALAMGRALLEALDYVGVIGVELFVTERGLLVNEIAPRVHNSGHWTQNGATVDQFEQHIRAIAGWPLGDGSRFADLRMTNLIGDEVEHALALAEDPANALHLYGKAEVLPGRKMGHVNRIRQIHKGIPRSPEGL